jgi:two-component system sensor histidine kinase BaeS
MRARRPGPAPRPEERPPWWPEGEAWPPAAWSGPPWWRGRQDGPAGHWGMASRGVRRRIGCFVVLAATVLVSTGLLVLWLLGTLLGIVSGHAGDGDLVRAAAIIVLGTGVVTIIGGSRLARSIGGPLDDLVDAAGRVERGDLAARVPERRRGPRELRNLGRAFNTMAGRLEADEAQRRRLLADIGHELRTPLTVIEGHVEALIDGVYPADQAHLEPILEAAQVMARLVEDLRTLTLAEAGALALHREPTDVQALLEDVAAALGPKAEAAGVRLEVRTPRADAHLPAADLDQVRIREVVTNLVDNAIRYSPNGGTVHLAAVVDGDDIELEVRDEGPGIAPELRERLFDRFAKGADSTGSGLGLAIARGLVEAHGGSVRAEAAGDVAAPGGTRPAGPGTRIVARLPIG